MSSSLQVPSCCPHCGETLATKVEAFSCGSCGRAIPVSRRSPQKSLFFAGFAVAGILMALLLSATAGRRQAEEAFVESRLEVQAMHDEIQRLKGLLRSAEATKEELAGSARFHSERARELQEALSKCEADRGTSRSREAGDGLRFSFSYGGEPGYESTKVVLEGAGGRLVIDKGGLRALSGKELELRRVVAEIGQADGAPPLSEAEVEAYARRIETLHGLR